MLNRGRLKIALKKSLILLLVSSFIIVLPSCKKTAEDTVDKTQLSEESVVSDVGTKENITGKEDTSDSDVTENEDEQTDNNSPDYDKMIADIMSINYVSDYELFNEYDIYNAPSRERDLIKEQNLESLIIDEEQFNNRSYNWYNNGVVDEEKIYNKILMNNIKGLIINGSDTKLVAKTVSEVLQFNLDLMKERHPDYDLDLALYAIDNLTVIDYDSEEFIAFMDYGKDRIYVAFNQISDLSTLKYSVSHELFHLINAKSFYREDVLKSGVAIDAISSTESPLKLTFLSEFTVESYSYIALGAEDPNNYWDTYYLVDLLGVSMDRDRQFFRNCFVNNDRQSLINSFEDGYDNFNSAYAIYNAIDMCIGSAEPNEDLTSRSDYDKARFNGEACSYLIVNLYKNLCIRLANELKNGTITEAEVKELTDDFKIRITFIQDNMFWVTIDADALEDCIASIDNVFVNNLSIE